MSECIRRPYSYWTSCACESCRVDMLRKKKIHAAGYGPHHPGPQAAERVALWIQRGYTQAWIASAVGLPDRWVYDLADNLLAGRATLIGRHHAEKVLRADISTGTAGYGPVIGARRRLQALACIGWSQSQLAAETGMKPSTIAAVQGMRRTNAIRACYDTAIRESYSRLQMRPGSSATARRRAVAEGWAPPLAWDSIDDPAAEPYTETADRRIEVEDIEEILTYAPVTTSKQLAERFGCSVDGIQQACRRAGRADLLAKLARNAELAA